MARPNPWHGLPPQNAVANAPRPWHLTHLGAMSEAYCVSPPFASQNRSGTPRSSLARVEGFMGKRERFQLSVSVFAVLRREDQVLLIRRTNTGWLDGLFSVPAGAMDGDEPAALAAIREAAEEASVSINPDDTRLAHTLHCRTEGNEWLGLFFEVFAWEGTPSLGEPERHSDLTWTPLSELPSEMVPYVGQALTCISKDVAYSEFGW